MAKSIQHTSLSDLVEIMPGYPFRGAVQAHDQGEHWALLPSAFQALGVAMRPETSLLTRVKLTGRREPDLLKEGDIIFLAKGTRNTAGFLHQSPDNIVCSPHFFHLRIKAEQQSKVLPQFIAWQLNSSNSQKFFKTIAQGSASGSIAITKQELGGLPIALPSYEQQVTFCKLYSAQLQQQAIYKKLIHNSQQLVAAVGNQLINDTNSNR